LRLLNFAVKTVDTNYRMKKKSPETSLIPKERIEHAILLIRGHKVMLDSDLAALYDVTTKALNQAVSRNVDRFPNDFMFQLTRKEAAALSRSQFVTLKRGQNIKYRPHAFTEQGVAMLSSCCAASGPWSSTLRLCELS
jgi:hypothetical protein